MRDKVLIINSPLFREQNQNRVSAFSENSLPPIGLGYIATVLNKSGVSTKLIDTVSDMISIHGLKEHVNRVKPEFLAINIFSTNLSLIQELIESIKIKSRILIGGIAAKALYDKVFQWNTRNYIDIVYGDGEFITLDIVKDTIRQKPAAQDGRKRYFVVDENSEYFVKDISNVELDRTLFLQKPKKNYYEEFEESIITSRGCVNDCKFCSAARSLNTEMPVREKSTDSIKKELHYLRDIYSHLQSVRILDDLFLKNTLAINKSIDIFSNTKFSWRSMAHIMAFRKVSYDTLQQLRQSGCRELFLGIESGSNKILEIINKKHTVSITKMVIEKIFKSGINVKGYFVLGFPEENESDYKKTFQLALFLKKKSKEYGVLFRVSVFQFRPYHGTKIYDEINNQYSISDRKMEANLEITGLIGRSNFNFHTGNYSNTGFETLNRYINLLANINNEEKA